MDKLYNKYDWDDFNMLSVIGIIFLFFLFFGVPIAFTMGASASIGVLFFSEMPAVLIPQQMFEGVNSFTLIAIPLFMLTGQLMETGGISRRIVDFSYSIIGFIKGGLGITGILTSTIFAGISGSASADTAAVGSIMIPAMKRKRYPTGLAATIIACAGSLGTIIPPSMVMIIYGSITGVSIGELFISGIIPGILMALGLMIVTYFYGHKYHLKEEGKIDFSEVLRTTKEAIWALVLPFILIGGILTGVVTPTEVGVIGVIYAFIAGTFIYKEIKLKEIPDILKEASANSTMAIIIISGASILGWLVAYEGLPQKIISSLTLVSNNKTVITLLVLFFILFIGMFIETIAATIMVAPILVSVTSGFDLDPLHFGFLMVAGFVFAGITPPVGGVLFISAGIGRAKMKDLLPYVPGYVGVMLLVLLLIVFFPTLATFLPDLFFSE